MKVDLLTRVEAHQIDKLPANTADTAHTTKQSLGSIYFRSAKALIDRNAIASARFKQTTSVDALENYAFFTLDEDLNVLRSNRTVELWGWGTTDSIEGIHIMDLLKPIIKSKKTTQWVRQWCQLKKRKNVEWESICHVSGKKYRFIFSPNNHIDGDYCIEDHVDDGCHAVLVIEDISNRKLYRPRRNNSNINTKKNKLLTNIDKNVSDISEYSASDRKSFKQYKKQLDTLAEQLVSSRESERHRVSREIHDGVGQILSALKYQVESMYLSSENTARRRQNDDTLQDVLGNIKVALNELRQLSNNLRFSNIDEQGLLVALRRFCREYSKIYTKIKIIYHTDITEADISEEMKIGIYRIVQEAMNNIAKHSHANEIEILFIKHGSGVMLSISDDGCGFDINKMQNGTCAGIGLKSMEERARSTGAKLALSSSAAKGTTVMVLWNCSVTNNI